MSDDNYVNARTLIESETFNTAKNAVRDLLIMELIATTSDEDCIQKRHELKALDAVIAQLQTWAHNAPK